MIDLDLAIGGGEGGGNDAYEPPLEPHLVPVIEVRN